MLTKVVVGLDAHVGALADLGELLGRVGVNIHALAVVRATEGRVLAVSDLHAARRVRRI